MIESQKKVFFCYCIKNDAPLFIVAPSLENICNQTFQISRVP